MISLSRVSRYSYRLFWAVFLCGLLVLPWVWWPKAEIAYEIPKVVFVWRWVEVLGVLGILAVPTLRPRKLDGVLLLSMLGFVGVAMVASLMGVDWQRSVWGNFYRRDGLVTLWHLVGLALLLMLLWEKKWRKWTVGAILAGAVSVAGWAVLEWWKIRAGEIGVTFGQPNFLAGYLLVTLPLWMAVRARWRWLAIVQVAGLWVTGALAGKAGLGLLVGLWLLTKRKKWWIAAAVIVMAAAVFGWVKVQQRGVWWQQQEYYRVNPGTHVIEVVVEKGEVEVDAFLVEGNEVVEDGDSQIEYEGKWEVKSGLAGPSGGMVHRSRQAGAKVKLEFTGKGITYVYSGAPFRGIAQVYIDGGMAEMVDQAAVAATDFDSRQRIVYKLLLGFWQRPLLGWGWANVDHAFAAVPWPMAYLHDIYVDKAHSHLLEILVTTGIIGTLAYGFLLGRIGWKLWFLRTKSGWWLSLWLVFGLYVFHTQTNITSIAEEVVFWVVVGIVGSKAT